MEKVLIVDYPLTISGICKKSGSSDSATGKHTGELEEAPHFRGHINYEWSDKVPAFYSVQTIWADSSLAALNDLSFSHLIKFFNLDVISAYCLKSYPKFRGIIIENLVKNLNTSPGSVSIKFHLLKGFIKGPFVTRLKAILMQLLNKKTNKIFYNVPDINNASEMVQLNIKSSNDLLLNNIQHII